MTTNKYEKYLPHTLAFFAAFSIFLLMQYLITTDIFSKKNNDDVSYLEFIRINSDDSLLERDRKIPERPKPDKRPPPPPDIDLQQDTKLMRPDLDIEQCPIQAIQGGIDGTVQIYLVVGPNGRVKLARIVRATNGTLFNKEATKAIRRWQFKPKVINGIPVEQAGELTIEFICNA